MELCLFYFFHLFPILVIDVLTSLPKATSKTISYHREIAVKDCRKHTMLQHQSLSVFFVRLASAHEELEGTQSWKSSSHTSPSTAGALFRHGMIKRVQKRDEATPWTLSLDWQSEYETMHNHGIPRDPSVGTLTNLFQFAGPTLIDMCWERAAWHSMGTCRNLLLWCWNPVG